MESFGKSMGDPNFDPREAKTSGGIELKLVGPRESDGVAPIESPPRTSYTSQYKVLLYLHAAVWTEFHCQTILHPNSLGVRSDGTRESKMVLIEKSTRHSCAIFINNIGLPTLHRLAIIHNVANRQTEQLE